MKTILKTFAFSTCFLLFLNSAFSQQVTYDWKHTILGYNYTALCCMATDSSGNVYVGGRIDSVVVFIDTTLTHDVPTGFLAKFNPQGDMIWFKQFEHSQTVYSICFDSENMLYISGSFIGKVEINDTVFPTFDSDTNFNGMFLAKFDTDGNLIWAKTTGGSYYYETGFGKLKQMTIDHDDNIIVVGYGIGQLQYFDTTVTYTRPLDSVWVTDPWPHWNYYYKTTNYLVKYNKDGQKILIKDLGLYYQEYYSIATDYSNNILLTGIFTEGPSGYDFILDTIVFPPLVGQNIFIAKYDQNGQVVWAQRAGGVQYSTNKGFDVCADNDNGVYLTGRVGGGGMFGDSIYDYTANGSAYILKYDSIGHVCWVKCIGSAYHENGINYNYGISLMFFNNEIYLCGFFADSLLFDDVNLISTDARAGMVLRFGTDGDLLAALMDSIYDNAVTPIEIAFTEDSGVYIAGNIAHIWNGEWLWDMFLGKFHQYQLSDIEIIAPNQNNTCLVYPNPCRDVLNFRFSDLNKKKITIMSINGDIISQVESNLSNLTIDIIEVPPGLYIVIIQSKEYKTTTKIVKL